MSSHNTDWILFEFPMLALSCLLSCRVSSLMNALEGKCLCVREISTSVNKLFTLLMFVDFVYVCICRAFVKCLLVYSLFFILHCCCCLFTSLSLFCYTDVVATFDVCVFCLHLSLQSFCCKFTCLFVCYTAHLLLSVYFFFPFLFYWCCCFILVYSLIM